MPASPLRLRGGVIVWLDAKKSRLLDTVKKRERLLEPETEAALEPLLVEGAPPPHAEELLAEGWLEAGAPHSDPELARHLAALDEPYLAQYRDALTPRARQAYARVLGAHAWRKRFLGSVGQCAVIPETALRRALRLGEAPRRVLCFGDDDLVSVALAALGHAVTVLDIDPYLHALIARAAPDLGIEGKVYDARDPAPLELGVFDAFYTDPMSNRACFELFLSRILPLVREGGDGFVAVHPPARRVFADIAAELGLTLEASWQCHNRYYAANLKPEAYVSDLVQVRTTPTTKPRYAADELAMPAGLYRDEVTRRDATMLTFMDGIETRFAMPMFLDLLFDVLEAEAGIALRPRMLELEQEHTVVHGPLQGGGHLMLHVDRAARQLMVRMHPFDATREEKLRSMLMASFKREVRSLSVAAGRTVWDLRLG